MSTPGKSVSTEPPATKTSKWWWIPVGVAVAALVAGLLRMLTRRRPEEPVTVAARPAPVVKPTPPSDPVRPAPVVKASAPKPPAPPTPPAPAKVAPLAAVPQPPAPRPLMSEPPKATVRTEATDRDLSTVVNYEQSATAAETTVRVTYENNAVGDNQASVADKSDSIRD